ncbi:MAG: glycosyltransferase [Patescibacteria group bacterium]
MSKKTVAIFTAFQGHVSIAEAIIQTLKPKYKIKIFKDSDILLQYYLPIYKFFPSGFGSIYKLSQGKKTAILAENYFRLKYEKKIESFFSRKKPDIAINTHYFFNKCLGDLSKSYNKPFINVFTDPKTIHPILIAENANQNLAFDKNTIKISRRFNPKAKVSATGWFVRDEYEQNYQKKEIRKKLKISEDKLTFLIVSGSDGTTAIMKILPIIFSTTKDINIIVACGNNKTLFKVTKALENNLRKTRKNITLTALPFTKKLYKYMQASDLVIGKAGPNTLFETVATVTPFFAITHIAGQEDGNLDIIIDSKLGYVEENPIKASKVLADITNNPQQLAEFQTSLRKMKDYNQKSKIKLLTLVDKLLRQTE